MADKTAIVAGSITSGDLTAGVYTKAHNFDVTGLPWVTCRDTVLGEIRPDLTWVDSNTISMDFGGLTINTVHYRIRL